MAGVGHSRVLELRCRNSTVQRLKRRRSVASDAGPSYRPPPYRQHLHRRVPPVDPDHAPARMRPRAAEEHARHRRPRLSRRSHMYAGRISPWKMCPPVRPTRRSMSGGPSTSIAEDRPGQVAAEAGDRVHHRCPASSRRVSQLPSLNRCGTYWANTLSVCTPVGRDAPVEHRLQVELAPGARRQHALVGQPVMRRATRPW